MFSLMLLKASCLISFSWYCAKETIEISFFLFINWVIGD